MYDKYDLTRAEREQARKSNNRTVWKSSQRENRKRYDKAYEENTRERIYRSGKFVAVDGEGVNSCGSDEPCGEQVVINAKIRYRNHKPGCQRYALLMSSEDEGISNIEGLPTKECLDYLLDLKSDNPGCIFVIFGGSYDGNMILKDLPRSYIQLLQKKKQVYWRNYRIAYVARKYFQVSELQRWRDSEGKRVTIRTITLWDVIGFFQ